MDKRSAHVGRNEDRAEAGQEPEWEVVHKTAFFDASAIVKLVLPEPGSLRVSTVLAECHYAHTSWVLIAEALGCLKRKWQSKKPEDHISEDAYRKATLQLLLYVEIETLRAVDVRDGAHGPRLVGYFQDVLTIRQRHPTLDVADALQFRAIKEGLLRHLAGVSQPRLVSSDRKLLRAAELEGILTIDVRSD